MTLPSATPSAPGASSPAPTRITASSSPASRANTTSCKRPAGASSSGSGPASSRGVWATSPRPDTSNKEKDCGFLRIASVRSPSRTCSPAWGNHDRPCRPPAPPRNRTRLEERRPPGTGRSPRRPCGRRGHDAARLGRPARGAGIAGGVMTNERAALEALARCRFAPATFVKRFAASLAATPEDYRLTAKQRACLYRYVVKYRRQISPRLVEHARVWLAVPAARRGFEDRSEERRVGKGCRGRG